MAKISRYHEFEKEYVSKLIDLLESMIQEEMDIMQGIRDICQDAIDDDWDLKFLISIFKSGMGISTADHYDVKEINGDISIDLDSYTTSMNKIKRSIDNLDSGVGLIQFEILIENKDGRRDLISDINLKVKSLFGIDNVSKKVSSIIYDIHGPINWK
jgi:uncharacterized protein (UPF0335 family)